MSDEATPGALGSNVVLGLSPDSVADLAAMKVDVRKYTDELREILKTTSPDYLLTCAVSMLANRNSAARYMDAECERLRAVLAAIDKHSVTTLRTNSNDRRDWAEDVAFMGKLSRGH